MISPAVVKGDNAINAAEALEAPVPPFAIGSIPNTPEVNGRPVAFVKTSAEGVPKAGVTKVGLVANTTAPLPVVEAALIAVPLPCKIPVMVVLRVNAGFEPPLDVPAKPLALATEILDIDPAPTATQAEPL
jgi:hypothetical protein